jgi:hypothetical protein
MAHLHMVCTLVAELNTVPSVRIVTLIGQLDLAQTRRSMTGSVVKCGLESIAWKAATQATISRSFTESEYIAAGEVAEELQYVHQLAPQFGRVPGCIPVGCDNNPAMSLVEDPISAARTKHIDIIEDKCMRKLYAHER